MVPFEIRISTNVLFKNGLHILCNQFRHTTSQDLEVFNYGVNIYPHTNKLYSCRFLASDGCSKTRRVVSLFLNIAGLY